MKDQLEIVNTSFEKVISKNEYKGFWGGLWQFLTVVAVLIFCGFYLLFLNPLGWISLIILTCLYKIFLGF
jgi:hypothetical protein